MKKILIADDDVDILTLMEAMLSIHRFKVQTVSNWHIDSSVAQFEPDLILLDISLGALMGAISVKPLKKPKQHSIYPDPFSANAEMGRNIEQYHAQAFIAETFSPFKPAQNDRFIPRIAFTSFIFTILTLPFVSMYTLLILLRSSVNAVVRMPCMISSLDISALRILSSRIRPGRTTL